MYDTQETETAGLRPFREGSTTSAVNKATPELATLCQRNQEVLDRTGSAIVRIRSAVERLRGAWPEKDDAPQRNAIRSGGGDGALSILRTQVERAQSNMEMLDVLAGLLDGAV